MKCYRCEKEYEKLYMVPYFHDKFIGVTICKDCSMDLHALVKDVMECFLWCKKTDTEHWSETKRGKQEFLDILNETFMFQKNGDVIRRTEND